MIRPDYKEFLRLSRGATLVPVAKSISADLLTPVSAFLAVADGEPDAFLLESVEGGEKIGRYTFLGVRPFLRLESRGAEITIERDREVVRRTGNVFQVIKELLQQHRPAAMEGLPPFTAGAVGYCAYDIVRRLENIGEHASDDLDVPDCVLMFFDRVLAFDHLRHQIHIVASADVTREAPRVAYERAVKDIARIEKKLAAGWKPAHWRKATAKSKLKVKARTPKPKFLESVRRAKGVHRRRRHLPGRPLAALGFRARSRSARSVPRAADSESVAIYVLLTLRRRKTRRPEEAKQERNRRRRNTRPRIVAGNAGAGQRLETRVPSDRRHAPARKRRSGRRCAREENAGRREGARPNT